MIKVTDLPYLSDPAVNITGSEDCLFLNVFAPKGATKLPVMIWIHSGGYGQGDGGQDQSLVINANEGAFVVVSIQYRVSTILIFDGPFLTITGIHCAKIHWALS